MGQRGTLSLASALQARWETGELEEDLFSLVAKRSEMLGLAQFSGEPHTTEQWAHCDAGGAWDQDGEEHLLAWLQADVRTGGVGETPPSRGGRRLLPIASTLAVLCDALEQIGTVSLTEADAIVPLGLMADPIGRLAVARDWLLASPHVEPRRELVVTVEAGGSATKVDDDRLADGVAMLGEEVLGPIAARRAEGPERPAEFLHHRFTRSAIELRATTSCWSVDLAAWMIELTARALRELGVRESVLISVRHGEPVD